MANSVSRIIEAVAYGDFNTLKGVETVPCADGSLFCIAGGESVVFKVFVDGAFYALKCYTTDHRYHKFRYEYLSKLSQTCDIIPPMTYLEKELSVIDDYGVQRFADVLVYPWVEGVTLTEAIEKSAEFYDSAQLMNLCRSFTLLAQKLLSLPVSHGDLKPQNLIVGSEGMSFIDFDTAFSEEIPSEKTVRTRWYQHPLAESWDEGYAVAVITLSLFLLALDPQLFYKYHNGENIIIDAAKIVNAGTMNREFRSMLVPYPNYLSLFELIAAPEPLSKDITSLLSNVYGAVQPSFPVLDDAGPLRRVVNEKGLYGFIDGDDKLVIGCCYGDATSFNDGVAGVNLNGAWYLFNAAGHCAVNEIFDEVGASGNGIVPVSKDRRWYYLNSYTFERLSAEDYDYVYPFSGGFGLVRDRNRFYYIDRKGERAFGAKNFVSARSFVGGYAVVSDDKGYFVIDGYGRCVSRVIAQPILRCDGTYFYYRDKDGIVKAEI